MKSLNSILDSAASLYVLPLMVTSIICIPNFFSSLLDCRLFESFFLREPLPNVFCIPQMRVNQSLDRPSLPQSPPPYPEDVQTILPQPLTHLPPQPIEERLLLRLERALLWRFYYNHP